MGCCNIQLFAVAASCFGIFTMIGLSEGAPRWSSVHRTTGIPDECKHQRQSQWYALWSSGYQDCDEKHRTKFTAKEKGYPNRDAFRLSRLATNVLALVCASAGVYYALTGCLCRVRIVERLAAVAMVLAGGLALSAASFWIYRFDMRPYDDDLTDDQMVCDVGCQLEFAAGSLAMILGFVMCCLANGVGEPAKLVGGPHAADLELAIPAEYRAATTPKHWRRPDARAGTPPYYVSPIADLPRTEV